MAKVASSIQTDFSASDLNFYYRNLTDSIFEDDSKQTFAGKTYRDWFFIAADDGDYAGYLVGAGADLEFDALGNPSSGTVTLLIETNYNQNPLISIQGTSIPFAALYKAATTPDSYDDFVLFQKALSGDDSIALSPFDDVASGFAGNDKIRGGGGNDALFGSKGNDTIFGGLGADTLSGGAGADVFGYNNIGEFGDQIDGFGAADTLQFKAVAIGAPYKGILKNANFWASFTGVAHDLTDRFIYNRTDGTLWFDSDGSASSAREFVAVLTNHFSLTAGDIILT